MAAYRRVYDSRHLQAKNRDQLRNPTLGNRVWATFTFTFLLTLLDRSSASLCRCTRGLGYVDDRSLERLSVLFPRLADIELRLCALTDDGLARFCRHNQRHGGLTGLALDHPGDISDAGLSTLVEHCPALQRLTLARCQRVTNEGLRSGAILI